VEKSLNRNAATRARIAFFLLFVFLIVGAYVAVTFAKYREQLAARESQAALQEVTDPGQLDEAIRRHPSNRVLQTIARAAKAADETSVAAEKLLSEIEPPSLSKDINYATASRGDLDALRNDLKTAQTNATTVMPRFLALFKTERDTVERYALSLGVGKDTVARFLESVDRRHAETTANISRILLARADYYRAYENYVTVLAGELGGYKVVNGEFIFPLQRTVDRYNVAARAMTAAAKRVAELEEERKKLMQPPQPEEWVKIVNGK
jgi:hypothetical protein